MPNPAFHVTARAQSAVIEVGTPIKLEIEVQNVSTEAADLHFASSQKFEFEATPLDERGEVWRYSTNRRFAEKLSAEHLEAGESRRFETTWQNAIAGRYLVQATLRANGDLRAPEFEIEVK